MLQQCFPPGEKPSSLRCPKICPKKNLKNSSTIELTASICRKISLKIKDLSIANIILVITATLTGLVAGLFYAWSCSVMLGFARLKDREFVSVMQKTNRAILNPVFFISFLGAPVLLPISTFLSFGNSTRFALLLAATIIYLTGTFGVTVFGNVPLNNTLDRFELETATEEAITRQRANFERRWNNLNTIRTVTSTLALILIIIACLN